MGGGSYSFSASTVRSNSYRKSSRAEIFTQRIINNEMNPANTIRECCDSEEHPETIPIIIALDVTGSMGYVPEKFIKDEMTKIMTDLYQAGLTHAQVLFMGIGDHECDNAPLQVGQFEADDQLLDKWLKNIYLEGGGGGNDGESYLLAWYYGANYTMLDSLKRGKKGFIFTIGDEHTLTSLPIQSQERIFGKNGVYENETSESLLKQAQEKYHVYHLHLTETGSGARKIVQDRWKQLMHENCYILESNSQVAKTIAEVIKAKENVSISTKLESTNEPVQEKLGTNIDNEEMML